MKTVISFVLLLLLCFTMSAGLPNTEIIPANWMKVDIDAPNLVKVLQEKALKSSDSISYSVSGKKAIVTVVELWDRPGAFIKPLKEECEQCRISTSRGIIFSDCIIRSGNIAVALCANGASRTLFIMVSGEGASDIRALLFDNYEPMKTRTNPFIYFLVLVVAVVAITYYYKKRGFKGE